MAASSFGQVAPAGDNDLSRAKTIAVLVRSVEPWTPEPAGFSDQVRARVVDEIQKRKRFQVVDRPEDADLVCLYLMYALRWVQEKKTILNWHPDPNPIGVSFGASVIILKGGAARHWDAAPLWMATDIVGSWDAGLPSLMRGFHRAANAGKPQQPVATPAASRADGPARTKVFVTCLEPWTCDGAKSVLSHVDAHWDRVDDPSRADLVLIWFNTSVELYRGGVPSLGLALMDARQLGAFLVLKAGRPDWDTMPLLALLGGTTGDLFEPLEQAIPSVRAPAPAPPPRAAQSSSPPARGRKSFAMWSAPPAESSQAIIYIARDSDRLAKPIAITVDGEKSLNVYAMSYNKVAVSQGSHILAVSGGRGELTLFTDAGSVSYVIVDVLGNLVGLRQTDAVDGRRRLMALAPR